VKFKETSGSSRPDPFWRRWLQPRTNAVVDTAKNDRGHRHRIGTHRESTDGRCHRVKNLENATTNQD